MACTNTFAAQNENQLALKLCDAALLHDAKHGKAESFEKVCQALRPRLLKIALRITRNREDAEDAVQDSLMSAYVHIGEFQGKSAFSTWLTRILMNSALMIVRKNRNVRQVSTEASSWSDGLESHFQIAGGFPNPEQTVVQHERTRVLHRAIGKLRPRLRSVIKVAQLHDLPIKETAKVLGISVAAAKGRFFHARAQLRKSVALRAIAPSEQDDAARKVKSSASDYNDVSSRFVNVELDLAITFCEFGLVTANKAAAKRNAENARKALSTVEETAHRVTFGSLDKIAISEKVAHLTRLLTELESDLQSLP
jgi:RNA polymerase sigma-70 factor, ECF subfamily